MATDGRADGRRTGGRKKDGRRFESFCDSMFCVELLTKRFRGVFADL